MRCTAAAGPGGIVAVVVATLAFTGPAIAQAAPKADSGRGGTIVAVVVAKENAMPLAHGVVSLLGLGRDQFTDDRGKVVLTNVPAGRVQLRARHLGYTPADLAVLVRANRVDTVRLELSRIAVRLTAIRVRALGACTNPGPPRPSADPAFAAIFDQLRENADQYRLLADAYPFVYSMERMSWVHYVGGDSVLQRPDTIVLGTGVHWHYVPGALVTETDDPRNRQVLFTIPTLIHFAEQSFLNNHCFANGGVDPGDAAGLIRIDFAAASRIRNPDVDGAMYLDPVTYQIRRSVLRLTRIPEQTPQITSVEVVTEFREVLPSIPLVSTISSTHVLSADPARPVLPDAAHETQRLLRVTFLKDKPGETPVKPESSANHSAAR